MFEKEAKEYLENFADCANCKERWGICADSLDEYCLVNDCCYATPKEQDIYIAGAEFGYNKANEWHFVKDGNPNNENNILCQISKDEVVVGYYHTIAKRYITIDGQDLYNVIAWKEIVLPKE